MDRIKHRPADYSCAAGIRRAKSATPFGVFMLIALLCAVLRGANFASSMGNIQFLSKPDKVIARWVLTADWEILASV